MSEPGLGLVDLGDGRWGFRFRPVDQAAGRAHVDNLITTGGVEQLAYHYARGETKPARKSVRKTEAEQVALHKPLVEAMTGVIYRDENPGPVPAIPPTPAGYDAITGQRLAQPQHAVRVGDETIGIEGQVLMELLRSKLDRPEQPQLPVRTHREAPPATDSEKSVIGSLIGRWKAGQH